MQDKIIKKNNRKNLPKCYLSLDNDLSYDVVRCAVNLGYGIKIGHCMTLKILSDSKMANIINRGHVFLDMKFFDIPNTVINGIYQYSKVFNISTITIHSLAGKTLIEPIVNEFGDDINIAAVTILTSHDRVDDIFNSNESVNSAVSRMAKMAKYNGIDTVVCSYSDVPTMQELKLKTIVPGFRLSKSSNDDQKRVFSESNDMSAISSVVVGRVIFHNAYDDEDVKDNLIRIYNIINKTEENVEQ